MEVIRFRDGRRARRNDADRLQISTKRPLEGSATEEEHAMANRRRGESHRGLKSQVNRKSRSKIGHHDRLAPRRGRRVNSLADARPHPCSGRPNDKNWSFDPHAGFVAGDDLRLAKDGLRLIGLDLEPRMGTMNMFISAPSLTIRQRRRGTGSANARRKPPESSSNKSPAHGCAVQMASSWRRGRRSFYPSTAMCAAADEAPVAHDIGLDRRISISSYSPINSISASGETDPPHSSQ